MPEPIPADLLELAARAVVANPRGTQVETVCEVLRAVLPAHDRQVRERVAADLRRAAEGRRYYAASAPYDHIEYLNGEGSGLDMGAQIAEGSREAMCAALPVVMWTDAEDWAAAPAPRPSVAPRGDGSPFRDAGPSPGPDTTGEIG